MFKRIVSLILFAVSVILLCGCSSANQFGLKLATDGSDKIDYIYYEDEFAVYVVGGIMMVDIDGEAKMLELALSDGNISFSEIIASAEEDFENEDIEATSYPDGSVEYHYETFKLVKMNTYDGKRDFYFLPNSMSYYDVAN